MAGIFDFLSRIYSAFDEKVLHPQNLKTNSKVRKLLKVIESASRISNVHQGSRKRIESESKVDQGRS